MSDLVAIATHLAPQEAQMLRGRLEADGVFAVVVDENIARNAWIWGIGARVLVLEDQVAEAASIKQQCIPTPRAPDSTSP